MNYETLQCHTIRELCTQQLNPKPIELNARSTKPAHRPLCVKSLGAKLNSYVEKKEAMLDGLIIQQSL